MKKTLLLLLAIISFNYANSQDYESFLKTYDNGKELFNLERYGLAMQAFKPLTSSFNDNPFIKHANYYYGVSAFYEGQLDIALNTFKKLKNEYPSWSQIDEVKLWLGKIYLEKDSLQNGVESFASIKNENTRAYADDLLLSKLEEIDSANVISKLYEEYPTNKTIAFSLAKKIANLPLLDQDREKLHELVEKFDLEEDNLGIGTLAESEKKDHYNIALMLPFMIKDLKDNRNALRNQFVIDLYNGVLVGVEELNAMGIDLNIFAYDTESSEATTRKILNEPELQHMDLIYGPLYPMPVKLTNQFSYDYQINMFNPLSSNSKVVGNNPFSFLYMPSYQTQGEVMAEYVEKHLKNKYGAVFYGDSEHDSVMAQSFIQTMIQNGDSVILSRRLKETESKKIMDILTSGSEVEMNEDGKIETVKLYKISKDSIGYLMIASDNPSFAASAISALEMRGDSVTLLGKENWLNSQIISFDALERLNAKLLAPTYLDKSTNGYQYFKTIYLEKYNTLPSKNACIGYETIMLIGKLLDRYGTHFQNEFDSESIDGSLFGRYILKWHNDNQNIPIITFVEDEVKFVNR